MACKCKKSEATKKYCYGLKHVTKGKKPDEIFLRDEVEGTSLADVYPLIQDVIAKLNEVTEQHWQLQYIESTSNF